MQSFPEWEISIHAPRVGRDGIDLYLGLLETISIHAPRVGRDPARRLAGIVLAEFQSTRPVWGATAKSARNKLM